MPFTETGGALSYSEGVEAEFEIPGVFLISKPGATQNREFCGIKVYVEIGEVLPDCVFVDGTTLGTGWPGA